MSEKKKKDFLGGYKTYNPKKQGYGNATQWNRAFNARMGLDEAKKTLGGRDPLAILGFTSKPTSWDEIKKQYRKLAMQYHPDRNSGDDKQFKEVQAAYELLEEQWKTV
jgi:DnaJ-class molecular chaperone